LFCADALCAVSASVKLITAPTSTSLLVLILKMTFMATQSL
jgi:hypothetical protein